MNVLEAIQSRRTVRKYKAEPVPDDVIMEILKIARWSPSPVNSQPWRFVVIKDKKTLKKITDNAKYGSHLIDAPLAIAVVATPVESYHWFNEIEENKYAGAIAAFAMMLAAWEKGVSTGWISIDRDKVGSLLNIPEDHTAVALITMGYAAEEEPHMENDRRPVGSMIFAEEFGERFPRIDI